MHDIHIKRLYKKLEWANTLREGDFITVMKPPDDWTTLYSLWPVEFVKRSFQEKSPIRLNNHATTDFNYLTNMVMKVKHGDIGLITCRREPGYISAASLGRQVWMCWYNAPAVIRNEIQQKFNDILGDGSFSVENAYSFNIRVPFLHVIPMGFTGSGYIAPNIISQMKR